MKKVLKKSFFDRPVLDVAPELLGKFLVQKLPRGSARHEMAMMITEIEAYDGPNDKACHASKGRTQRTEPMFGEAGHFYVYLCYGMYWMLNVVTGPKDYPAAVLIRGAQLLEYPISKNLKLMTSDVINLSGPGKLTKHLKIDKKINTKPALPMTRLWFEDRGVVVKKSDVRKVPRIGVAYAGNWAKKPYRFILKFKR